MKTISNEGLKLIKSFESCKLVAYDDLQPNTVLTPSTKIIGTLTIGWGHTGNVKVGDTITQQKADSLLVDDLSSKISYVNNPSYVPLIAKLNQYQFDALVSFCYNCGQGNLKELCLNKSISEIPVILLRYNKSKGNVLNGLIRRRAAEKELYEKLLTPTETPKPIETNNPDRLSQLEESVRKIISELTNFSERWTEIPAPEWFVKEFPNALDLINRKSGTNDFWRSFAIALRITQNKTK